MTKILGVDISNFQGSLDFDKLVSNKDFVIIKATEGTGFIDPQLARNQSEARRVNILRGYYHFARPDLDNTANEEAEFFLKTIGSLVEGEVPVLDYEPHWDGDAVNWCNQWLDYVYNQTGCRPLIYLNQSQVKQYNWQPVIDAGFGLWIAAYTYTPDNNSAEIGQWPFAAMQQWTNKEAVDGISTQVDGDIFFGDEATFVKYGFPPLATPEVPISPIEWTDQTPVPLNLVTPLEAYNTLEFGALKSKLIAKDQEIKTDRELLAQASDNLGKIQTDVDHLIATLNDYKRANELQAATLNQKNLELEDLKKQLAQGAQTSPETSLSQFSTSRLIKEILSRFHLG